MVLRFLKGCTLSLLVIAPIGCQPNPAIEPPVERDEAEVDRDGDVDTTPESGVDVQVGGGEGVKVDIEPDDQNDEGVDVQIGGDSN
jgi:hypothetical protein